MSVERGDIDLGTAETVTCVVGDTCNALYVDGALCMEGKYLNLLFPKVKIEYQVFATEPLVYADSEWVSQISKFPKKLSDVQLAK